MDRKRDILQTILSSIRQRSPSYQRVSHTAPAKNFKRENLKRLREMQRLAQQREAANTSPVKSLGQPNEFRYIPSRLSGYTKLDSGEDAANNSTNSRRSRSLDRRTQSTNKAAKPKRLADNDSRSNLEAAAQISCKQMTQIPKLPLEKKEQKNGITEQKTEDNVKSMAQQRRVSSTPNIAETKVQKTTTTTKSQTTKHQMGIVPKYLVIRKKKWQQEEARRQKEAESPEVPPGHELLSEAERVHTLNLLEERYKGMLSKLSSLPVCSDTLRVRRVREELEDEILQTEEAIHIFSHSKVYVKNDV